MRIAVFQHVPFEVAEAITDWAFLRGHSLDVYCVYEQCELPKVDDYDALVVMGGPMGVHDTQQYPWLVTEQAHIKAAIDLGKWVLGVCLGAQLVAAALGAKVSRNPEPEIGWFELQSVGHHRLAQHFDTLPVFHWHGETFALPNEAQSLAKSEACEQQAFIYADRVLGLQCHLEFAPATVRRLIEHCAGDLLDAPYVQSPEEMLRQPIRFAKLHQALYRLLDDFFQTVD